MRVVDLPHLFFYEVLIQRTMGVFWNFFGLNPPKTRDKMGD